MMLAWYLPPRDIVTGILCLGVVPCGAGYGLDDGTLGAPHAELVEDEGRDGTEQYSACGEGHEEESEDGPGIKTLVAGDPVRHERCGDDADDPAQCHERNELRRAAHRDAAALGGAVRNHVLQLTVPQKLFCGLKSDH